MKKLLLLLLTSCTIMTEHPKQEVDLKPIDITVCSPGFLQTGWLCAELNGYPKWLHPVVVQFFGCAISYYDINNTVVQATIFADFDLVLEHEVKHLKGHNDGSEKISYDPVVVARTQRIIDSALERYKDSCYSYEPK